LPLVDKCHAARRELLLFPPEIVDQSEELADHPRANPHRLPPCHEVKSIGREGAKEVFRARVAVYRATYVFDGQVVRFTRF
jgi:hypothetical protein